MRVGRRNLLVGGACLLIVAGAAATPVLILRRSREAMTIAVVKDIFGDDIVDERQLAAFAKTYVVKMNERPGFGAKLVDLSLPFMAPVYAELERIGLDGADDRVHFLYIDIAGAFIRATNYADRSPGEPVQFLGFPTIDIPYSCTNRIARFDFDD